MTLTHRNEDASWVRVQARNMAPGWVSAAYLASSHKPFTYLPLFTAGEYAAAVAREHPGHGFTLYYFTTFPLIVSRNRND